MNTSSCHSIINSTSNNQSLSESLRYDSLFSYQKIEIDSKNNLHINKRSILKFRKDIVPLDLINPNPICKKGFNKSLMALAISSILLAGISISLAIIISKLWLVIFSAILVIFGVVTLITSLRNQTTIYQYKFVNTETLLFSLTKLSDIDNQVDLFIESLNKRIIRLNEKNDKLIAIENTVLKETNDATLECNLAYPDDIEIYNQGKQSQYMKHLDFLYNHGIVEEALYKRLNTKIHERVNDSNNTFAKNIVKNINEKNMHNNIIYFPIKA